MHLPIHEGFLRTSYNIVKWSSSKGGTVKLMFVAVLASYLQTVSNDQLLTQQFLYHLVTLTLPASECLAIQIPSLICSNPAFVWDHITALLSSM